MGKKFSKIICLYLTQALRLFLFLGIISNPLKAQTVIDELKAVSQGEVPLKDQVFSETITTVSTNKRIYIVTNSNQKLFMGDFVSFIADETLVLRALVVKTRDDKSGLKLVKVYQPNVWHNLNTGMNIQMIRGDDSSYQKQLNKERDATLGTTKTNESAPLVAQDNLTADEQAILGNDFTLDANLPSDGKKINANHLLYFDVGNYRSLGISGESTTYLHYRFGWGYQLMANWWTDLSYGYTVLKKYPAQDIDTALSTFTGKFGYVFQLPVHSFLYLYGGAYSSIAESPGAGEGGALTEAEAQNEIALVKDAEGFGYVAGLSFYKRLVPGWTFKIDLDTQLMAVGIMVEL